MATANDIVLAARSMLGVPFKHRGRNRSGVDCAGLVVVVARECGIKIKDFNGYGEIPKLSHILPNIELNAAKILTKDARAGDILLTVVDGRPQHLAIHCGELVIHCNSKRNKVVECRYKAIKPLINSAWRLNYE